MQARRSLREKNATDEDGGGVGGVGVGGGGDGGDGDGGGGVVVILCGGAYSLSQSTRADSASTT